MHDDLPFRCLAILVRERGGAEVRDLEGLLYPHRYWIPGDDPRHDCGNGEPLLDGCVDGYRRGLPSFYLQPGLSCASADGRFTAVGAQGREAESVDRRSFPIKGWLDLMSET